MHNIPSTWKTKNKGGMLMHILKKIILVIVSFALFLNINCITFAETIKPSIKSQSAILVDADAGKILYEKNAREKLEPASITKIMTLLLAFEAIDSGQIKLSDKVKISERAWKTGGSQVFLGYGEEQTVDTLLKCITIASANDASVAIAEHIAGSVENFVKMMNQKAKVLGMHDTNFTNPHGLSDSNHYTTALDIAIMSRELVKYPKFFEWSTKWIDYLEHTDKKRNMTMLANTNKLLGKYDGLDGLKTGYHKKAGFCFAGTARRNNFRLISVVLNAASSKQRFEDTIALLDYGFKNFDSVTLASKDTVKRNLVVEKGIKDRVNIIPAENYNIITEKGKDIDLDTVIELPEKLIAPIKKGQKVGTLKIKQRDKVIKQIDLISAADIPKATLLNIIKKVVYNWFIL